jgi:septum formation protein
MPYKVILASASPRRTEILTHAGIKHEVRPAHVEERMLPGEEAAVYAQRLAFEKADAARRSPDEIVLGADTVVVAPDGSILEKPASVEDACRMLKKLSGARHRVITGVHVAGPRGRATAAETTFVDFVALDPGEISAYVASGEPMDKAGAYAIQGLASRFVRRIEGCYFNVVGLPVSLVWRLLKAAA